MSQNKPQSPGTTRLIILVLAYGVMLFWMQRTMSQHPANTPQTAQAILAEAQGLDQQGRTNTQLTRADRIKKLEQAVNKYEDYYNANKKAPDAAQARFDEINIYDFLAQLEGPQGGNNYLDQAERRLKDMQKQLLRQQGTVKLEVDGKVEERNGDLGRIADE